MIRGRQSTRRRRRRRQRSTPRRFQKWPTWTDSVPLFWGALLLKYWLSGQLRRLIHPNYTGLVAVSGGLLLLLGLVHLWQQRRKPQPLDEVAGLAANLLSKKFAAGLLVGTAIAGLLIPPGTLGSQAALQRGLGSALPVTRLQPQAFEIATNPARRSLVDWVRTLNAYPEPEAYRDQAVRIEGFVMRLDTLPADVVLLTRFIVSCCAVDAYPVALPVVLPPETDPEDFPNDSWARVRGTMGATTSGDRPRQAIVRADAIVPIPTPRDPYSY